MFFIIEEAKETILDVSQGKVRLLLFYLFIYLFTYLFIYLFIYFVLL